jgi:hypothetical protein
MGDILTASSSKDEISKIKQKSNYEFEMKDLGATKKILGMGVLRKKNKTGLFLSQYGYLKNMVERFSMSDAKIVIIPLGHDTKLSIAQYPKFGMRRRCKVLLMQVW